MKFLKYLVATTVFLFSTLAFAESQLGKDYKELNPAQPVRTGEKIEVLEFFFYGCTHCFHLHPQLSAWEKKIPKDVELQLVPTIFRESWEPMARTFYALEAMGQQRRLHDDLFNGWNDNIVLDEEPAILDFLARRGIDRAKFSSTYNSFTINSKVERSKQMVRDYAIRGTPTIIVDGKYIVTGLNPEDMIRVLNDLIAKARKDRSKH